MVPVMLLYGKYSHKWNHVTLLRFSFVCFILRITAFALASSMWQLYVAGTFQAASYALYAAAIVPYVTAVTDHRDAAKAQNLAFSVITAGSLLASLEGMEEQLAPIAEELDMLNDIHWLIRDLLPELDPEKKELPPEKKEEKRKALTPVKDERRRSVTARLNEKKAEIQNQEEQRATKHKTQRRKKQDMDIG